jgi:hypothetical protein
MEELIKDNAIIILQKTIEQFKKTIDNWKNVIPEGLGLINKCDIILNLIPRIKNFSSLPEYNNIYKIIKEANDEIHEFITKDEKQRNLFGNMLWKSKRLYLATIYRESFQQKSNEIQENINFLINIINDSSIINEPKIQWFKENMSLKSYNFWLNNMGEQIYPRGAWLKFSQSYQNLYGKWNDTTHECIRRIVCIDGKDMSLYSFIALTKEYEFPINLETIPPLLQSRNIMSEEARMEIAKMVLGLMNEFSSDKMYDYINCMYNWYKYINKNDKDGLQKRANEWANIKILLTNKKNGDKSLEEFEVEKLDKARRYISFFYQRYMAMWRIGQVSRETFSDVDFPGKARIKDFLNYIRPLDYANYHIVIYGSNSGKSKEEIEEAIKNWPNKEPNVYKFLKELI